MYSKSDPIVIFLIQATIVIVFCRMLHIGLARLRQPRVIAEVIGGILLGPTAFGRIKNFTPTIFPAESIPQFNLAANLGLILFLFIVGLEVDLRLVRRNVRVALSVSAASLLLPFAFGCIMAWAINNEYNDGKKENFGTFLLFIGTAFSITAFPVLARILTELKLLRRDVGVTVLAAGVGNDVVGWILLALTIALVNSSTGITAFYVVLLVIAWTLILCFAVRPAYIWLARRTGMDSGPTDLMMVVTVLLVMVSAFYTDIIGVHPIFGAFLVGLIIPHENGYAVSITEKIEDLVSVLLLPLYFASSGLKTNVGLLDDGTVWGYTIGIIVLATVSKIIGAMLAARLNGFFWRESLTVGTLMSCKGLVELIVLNVGLSAGILSQKVFTMFVVMALVTTFMTTPLVMWMYPLWYQEKVTNFRSGEYDWDGNKLEMTSTEGGSSHEEAEITRIMLVVGKLEDISTLLEFTHLISFANINLYLSRFMEMTDRLSQIIKVSESDDLLQKDPLLAIFKTLTRIVGVKLSYGLHVLATYEYAAAIEADATAQKADLVVLPWAHDVDREWLENEYISTVIEHQAVNVAVILEHSDAITTRETLRRRTPSMRSILLSRPNTGIQEAPQAQLPSMTTKTLSGKAEAEKVHVYFPIFKFGSDEKLGLLLLAQMLSNIDLSSSIVFFKHSPQSPTSEENKSSKVRFTSDEVSMSSRPVTSATDSYKYGPSVYANQESEFSELQSFISTLPSPISLDSIDSTNPLVSAVDKYLALARQYSTSTLTLILTRSTSAATQLQIKHIDKQLLGEFHGGVTARGQVGEVFAAMKDRRGPIMVVQAKKKE